MHMLSSRQLGLAAAVGAFMMGTTAIGSVAAWAASSPVGYVSAEPARMTEAAVTKHITDENYTDVTNLKKVKDGWTASAKTLGTPVSLLVTDMGNIDQE